MGLVRNVKREGSEGRNERGSSKEEGQKRVLRGRPGRNGRQRDEQRQSARL